MKAIPNFPGYFVDEVGNVFSTSTCHTGFTRETPKQLKPKTVKHFGYKEVCLMRDGKRCMKRVHQLVLEAYVGPRPPGMLACHGANGTEDNSVSNLYWGTPLQNANDKRRDGTLLIGEKHPRAILTDALVREIRALFDSQPPETTPGRVGTVTQIARRYNLNRGTVSDIVYRRRWKHIVP